VTNAHATMKLLTMRMWIELKAYFAELSENQRHMSKIFWQLTIRGWTWNPIKCTLHSIYGL